MQASKKQLSHNTAKPDPEQSHNQDESHAISQAVQATTLLRLMEIAGQLHVSAMDGDLHVLHVCVCVCDELHVSAVDGDWQQTQTHDVCFMEITGQLPMSVFGVR